MGKVLRKSRYEPSAVWSYVPGGTWEKAFEFSLNGNEIKLKCGITGNDAGVIVLKDGSVSIDKKHTCIGMSEYILSDLAMRKIARFARNGTTEKRKTFDMSRYSFVLSCVDKYFSGETEQDVFTSMCSFFGCVVNPGKTEARFILLKTCGITDALPEEIEDIDIPEHVFKKICECGKGEWMIRSGKVCNGWVRDYSTLTIRRSKGLGNRSHGAWRYENIKKCHEARRKNPELAKEISAKARRAKKPMTHEYAVSLGILASHAKKMLHAGETPEEKKRRVDAITKKRFATIEKKRSMKNG